MKTAWLNLRHQQSERAAIFSRGLQRLGYRVEFGVTFEPGPSDVLCTWNRINVGDRAARIFEERGLPVLVTENASWGNGFLGRKWLTLTSGVHNTAGRFPVLGPERWNGLGVDLKPWRAAGETVILAQRGIGPKGTAMPHGWPDEARRRHGGRIRKHPGKHKAIPLMEDLKRCGHAVTWGSGAALLALMDGIRVTSEMPDWIGQQDNTDAGRLAMFQRLAWAQVELHEIEDASAFARLIGL